MLFNNQFKKHMTWTTLIRVCVNVSDDSTVNYEALNNLKTNVNETTEHANTPLHFASLGCNMKLMYWLIENGATIQANEDQQTPLHWACKGGNIEIVKLLCTVMTKEELMKQDIDNTTAYDWALEYQYDDIVAILQSYAVTRKKNKRRFSKTLCNPILKRLSFPLLHRIH